MFTNKKDVPQLLSVGKNWVKDLEEAVVATEEDAICLEGQARDLALQADATRQVAKEGRMVADNFNKMFTTEV